jgi:hypothetical protein
VAELASQGGFVANGELLLRAPQAAVYSDGTVVLDASKRFTMKPSDLSALVAALRKDLAGQPAVLRPPRPMPDASDTVLGVRQADGGYQRVAANALPGLGPTGAYPAVVFDAYQKLVAVTQSPGAAEAGPFASPYSRLVYLCPTTSANPPKPWPAGLPQPTNSPDGANCSESHVVSGAAVGAATSACQPASGAQPGVAYQSGKGIRTCQWRPALPDES